MTTNEKKSKGQVYTPNYIVKNILDLSHYYGIKILHKHVIDNSCGTGAFLCEIVKRYCDIALCNGFSLLDLKSQLETYIHGIEINRVAHEQCIENLNKVTQDYGIDETVMWDIICADAMQTDKYTGKMDFVLGNPPYVRVHNLEDHSNTTKKFAFAQNGMTDLYIIFYEIGLKMLNNNGILGYITPSSFFNSLAGNRMRQYLTKENLIESIVDLKHFQAFDSTTYTTIVILNKNRSMAELMYYQFDETNLIPYYVDRLKIKEYYLAGNFYFSSKVNLKLLKKVFENQYCCNIKVKNGYATLCDDVFIGHFDFDSKYIIPVIKASRGEISQIIYPYDKDGKPISENILSENTDLYSYLKKHKNRLLNRSLQKNSPTCWYSFGRTQALSDTYKDKIALNTLLRNSGDLKIITAPSGTGVYSGLYLTGPADELSKVSSLLSDSEFYVYISLLGKYKRGGYYTFSSKDIQSYLNYKLSNNSGGNGNEQ